MNGPRLVTSAELLELEAELAKPLPNNEHEIGTDAVHVPGSSVPEGFL